MAIAAFLLIATACGGDGPGLGPSGSLPTGNSLELGEGELETAGVYDAGMTVVFSPMQPVVKKPTKLLTVEPMFEPTSGRFHTRATTYSFINRSDGSGWRTHPNGECSLGFQGEPPFPNRSIPAEGALLRPGDYFSVNIYVDVEQMPPFGVVELRGVRLVYETNHQRFQQVDSTGALRVAAHAGIPAPLCQPSGWFNSAVPLGPGRVPAASMQGRDWAPTGPSKARRPAAD